MQAPREQKFSSLTMPFSRGYASPLKLDDKLCMYVLSFFFFSQSLSKVFISFPNESKRNPIRNTINKDLSVAGDLSSVSVIKDRILQVKGEKVRKRFTF